MIDALNDVIKLRVEEVLKSHFKATPEDFNAATFAIMKELSTVGGNLDKMLESGEGVHNLITFGSTTEEGQAELTEQLTRELTSSDNTIKIINTDEGEG